MSIFLAGIRNWRTALLGVIAGLLTILHSLQAVLDDDPATVFDGAAVLEALAGITIAVGLLFARDANVTSRQSGSE